MRRKKKVKVVQDPFAIVRKLNPGFCNHSVGDAESQYTEKCYNGSPLIKNICHIDFENIKRKNMMVV